MTLRVEVLPDWADHVSRRWTERLRPGLRMCVPSGATPAPVYARMKGGFGGCTVFALDEFGGLDPGHTARCDRMIEDQLTSHLDPRPELHSLDPGAADLDAECARYQALIDDGGLDLVLLGLGANGHLGLNEPGSPVDSPTRVVALSESTRAGATSYGADPPPDWGLTVGLAPLLAASEIWLLVTGSHKAAILRRTLESPIGADLPATFLRSHPNVAVLADEDAAGRL